MTGVMLLVASCANAPTSDVPTDLHDASSSDAVDARPSDGSDSGPSDADRGDTVDAAATDAAPADAAATDADTIEAPDAADADVPPTDADTTQAPDTADTDALDADAVGIHDAADSADTIDAPDAADVGARDADTADIRDAEDADRPDTDPPGPVTCTAPWATWFTADAITPPARGSNAWVAPSPEQVAAFADAVSGLVDAVPDPTAVASLEALGYLVCADGDVTLLAPMSGTGRPVIALRLNDATELVIETPHSFYEFDTLAQGTEWFETLQARALVASGTHRCSSDTPSTCDGTTSVCSASVVPYPVSDPAHNVDTFFHAAHVAIATRYGDSVVLSVHGMGGDGVSVSNGTTEPTGAGTPSARLAAALAAAFPSERITTCNAFDGGTREARLCGTTNVQGRHINGSIDACTDATATAGGRFIHIEQHRSFRTEHRDAVAAAIRTALLPD